MNPAKCCLTLINVYISFKIFKILFNNWTKNVPSTKRHVVNFLTSLFYTQILKSNSILRYHTFEKTSVDVTYA